MLVKPLRGTVLCSYASPEGPMSRISQLFDLQQIDTGLDRRVARMRQIDEQTADSPALLAARASHQEAADVLSERQAQLKRLTHEADDVSARLKSQEKRLYDGTIKNPKELTQVQEEVFHLKARLKETDDSVLEAMMAAEEAEQSLASRADELDLATKEFDRFKGGLIQEKDNLTDQAKVLQLKKHRLQSELPWADLQTYERLRHSKGGVAVAAVQKGLCTGCHVGVPAHVLRMARTSNDFTPCPTCGRILYPVDEVKFKEFDHDLDNIAR